MLQKCQGIGLNGFISKESKKYIPWREKTMGVVGDLPAKYNSLPGPSWKLISYAI